MASSLATLPVGNLTASGIGASTGICLSGIPSVSYLPTTGAEILPCEYAQVVSAVQLLDVLSLSFHPLPCARNSRSQAGETGHPFADILDSQTTDEPRASKVRVFIEDLISTIVKASVAAFIWGLL